jgi:hypothetical protein
MHHLMVPSNKHRDNGKCRVKPKEVGFTRIGPMLG